jgi:hypothetical protein
MGMAYSRTPCQTPQQTFLFTARLHTRNNLDFFKGTVVEHAVADELGLKTPLP